MDRTDDASPDLAEDGVMARQPPPPDYGEGGGAAVVANVSAV